MSESKVLFEITEKHLNTGLRAFPVGHVRTSRVDPDEGVSYVGYSIKELANLDPEAVIFLLFNKDLPNDEQLAAFKADIASRATIDPTVFEILKSLPRNGHPMEWLINGLTLLGMTGKSADNNYYEDGLNLLARAPGLIAAIFRIRSGWGDPIESKPELGLIENFVHMLGVPGGDTAKLTRLLRTFYVLHMDHGGGNLSTFSGKAVASGLADIYASMAAAMAGLYGPRHGRANQNCLAFVREVGTSDPAELDRIIRDRLANKQLIFGFGHAVLRAEDPRATIQYGVGQEICPDDELFKTALALRTVAVNVLKENPKISNPYPNVDAVSGTLLNASGLTDSDYYTTLFGLARIAGIAAQIVDERNNFRNGKGVAIYRCKFVAENQDPRTVPGATTTFKAANGRDVVVDAALWRAAKKLTAGKGDGRLGIEDANELFSLVVGDGEYSEIEKKTVKHIRSNFKWTDRGNETFRGLIRSAAGKGWTAQDVESALSDAE